MNLDGFGDRGEGYAEEDKQSDPQLWRRPRLPQGHPLLHPDKVPEERPEAAKVRPEPGDKSLGGETKIPLPEAGGQCLAAKRFQDESGEAGKGEKTLLSGGGRREAGGGRLASCKGGSN